MPEEDAADQVQKIVDRFAAYMEREGLSQKRAGAMLGISSSTLSQVLNDSYTGRRDRVARRMAKALRREEARDNRPEAPEYCPTHISEQVLEALNDAHVERALVCVLGPTGIGKTISARQYCQEEPSTIYLVGGPSATPKAFMMDLVTAAGIELPNSNVPARGVRDAIIEGLRDADRLIVIDEVDYLEEATLQHLRIIQEEAEVGMGLLGTHGFLANLQRRRSATLSQFLGRVSHAVYLNKASRQDLEAITAHLDLSEEAMDVLVEGANGEVRRAVHALMQVQREGNGYKPKTIRRAYRKQMPLAE